MESSASRSVSMLPHHFRAVFPNRGKRLLPRSASGRATAHISPATLDSKLKSSSKVVVVDLLNFEEENRCG